MTHPLRLGIWALVHGNRAALNDPEEPYDASWDRNRRLVLEAEALGYDCTLIAQHTANPHRDDLDQLEAWTSAAALAALSSRIEIITAIKPMLYNPVVLAKMALQIEHISKGRFAINLVNAWNRREIVNAGIPFLEHDERYAYGSEWLTVVEALMRGERVNFSGKHVHVEDYALLPKDSFRSRPRIYVGGESEPARVLSAAQADVWFINGQPLNDVAALIADVGGRPRQGDPLLFTPGKLFRTPGCQRGCLKQLQHFHGALPGCGAIQARQRKRNIFHYIHVREQSRPLRNHPYAPSAWSCAQGLPVKRHVAAIWFA